MAELVFSEQADGALTALETDPTTATTVARLWDALDALAADPHARQARRRRYQIGAWGIVVRDHTDDWLILWEPGPGDDEVTVLYLGPDL